MTSYPNAESRTSDREGIRRAALDYMQGWYEGDAERMRRSLHDGLVKRVIHADPETGNLRLYPIDKQRMVEKTEQGGGRADVPGDKRYYEVAILDVYEDIASARAESYEYIDYLHLARCDGQWLIVNVLWTLKRANQ